MHFDKCSISLAICRMFYTTRATLLVILTMCVYRLNKYSIVERATLHIQITLHWLTSPPAAPPHHQVPNYLPSISASISLVPERYIWRFCIGLHSAPRFLVAAAYFSFYRGRFAKSFPDMGLSVLALIAALAENVGLLLLTYVSSTETYSEYR